MNLDNVRPNAPVDGAGSRPRRLGAVFFFQLEEVSNRSTFMLLFPGADTGYLAAGDEVLRSMVA